MENQKVKPLSKGMMRSDNPELHARVTAVMAGEESEAKDTPKEEKKDPKKKFSKLKGGKDYSSSAIDLAVKKLSR